MADPLDPSLRDPAGFAHWTDVAIRFRDLDLLGHVNNVNLAGWLEDGRVALELPVQPVTGAFAGPAIVLLELRIQYLAEIHFGSAPRVGTRIQRIGRTSVTIGQAVFIDERCAAVAEAVEVLIDRESRRPMPWPDPFLTVFRQFQRPAQ